tara:strand:- start:70220 stop:70738 length:519 start_codon:yes stop_codon:yes gene_type:complete
MFSKWKSVGLLLGLVSVGSLQMLGDVLGYQPMKAIGAALTASPAPKVFTSQNGFETYSSQFFLFWTDNNGELQEIRLSPRRYRQLAGPYNRRNAYGAAISYAPVLYANEHTREMLIEVIDHGFCRGDMLAELGVEARGHLRGFRLEPRAKVTGGSDSWRLQYTINCLTGELQ